MLVILYSTFLSGLFRHVSLEPCPLFSQEHKGKLYQYNLTSSIFNSFCKLFYQRLVFRRKTYLNCRVSFGYFLWSAVKTEPDLHRHLKSIRTNNLAAVEWKSSYSHFLNVLVLHIARDLYFLQG